MNERIVLSSDTYIEYQRDHDNSIIISSLRIVQNEQADAKLNNPYNKGILACLIEQRGKDTGLSEEDIVNRAWPPTVTINPDKFDYARNVSERIRKLRNALADVIGKEAAKNLLPFKQKGFDYRICYPDTSVITSASHPVRSSSTVPSSSTNIVFNTLFELHAAGLTNLEIAQQLTKNDIALYGFTEHTPQEGSAEKWAAFMDEDPEAWGFLVRNNTEIIGNYSVVVLSDEQKTLLLNGELFDGEINLDDTLEFSAGTGYTLYILNISINTEYNSLENRRLLYDKLFELIITLAEKHQVYFREIYYTSWMFRKTLHSYGFKDIMKKDDGSIILGITDFPANLNWHRLNELLEVYS